MTTDNGTDAKYEYMLHVWGGFWNEHNIKVHGEPYVPYQWFDSIVDLYNELTRLEELAKKHGTFDSTVASHFMSGYMTRYRHVIYSLVQVGDKIIEVENDLGYGFFNDDQLSRNNDDSHVQYMMESRWDICADLPDNHKRLFTTLILRK